MAVADIAAVPVQIPVHLFPSVEVGMKGNPSEERFLSHFDVHKVDNVVVQVQVWLAYAALAVVPAVLTETDYKAEGDGHLNLPGH